MHHRRTLFLAALTVALALGGLHWSAAQTPSGTIRLLTREGPLDELTVCVEAGPGLHHEHVEVRTAAEKLAYDIKVFVGTSARIDLRPPGGIERSLGKAKRVVDQRKL